MKKMQVIFIAYLAATLVGCAPQDDFKKPEGTHKPAIPVNPNPPAIVTNLVNTIDGKELNAFGVNFQTPISWEANRLNKAGISKSAEELNKVTDNNIDDVVLMGAKQLRCHLTPADFTDAQGNLPCLRPMSQIAGRLSIQEGAKYLEKIYGGSGVLLAGVPGTPKAKVVILGGGNVGTNACKIAVGMGADVTILDISIPRLAYLDDLFGSRIQTLVSTDANIEKAVKDADLVIGSVLIPGKAAPKLFKAKYFVVRACQIRCIVQKISGG